MHWRLAVAVPALAGSLAACADLDRQGSERMRSVASEQLCFWRDNPVSGRQMRRELARRGEDCGEGGAAVPAPIAEPATSIPPQPLDAPRPPPPPAAAFAAPQERDQEQERNAAMGLGDGDAPSAAAIAAQRPRAAAPDAGAAPLVAPACAERIVRRGGEGASPQARAVAFRNRCAFPIRVLYAAGASSPLTSLTGLLRPGETSGFAPIEDGFDQPGYVVCSYADVPTSQACRLGSGSG